MGHDEASRIHRRKMSEGREGRKARMGGDPSAPQTVSLLCGTIRRNVIMGWRE